MDRTKVSDMWRALHQANKLPSSELMSGAELELQELMRQIDVMVHTRKMEWEKERQTLLARLDVREKENNIQKSTLAKKHTEIGHLRAQLESVENSQRNATSQYEQQLSTLREEISMMKKEFEKLHRRYSKKAKHAKTVHQQSSSDVEESAAEIKRLCTEIEEYKKKAKEWEHQRKAYEEKIQQVHSTHSKHQAPTRLDEALVSNRILSDDKEELQTSLTQAHNTIKRLEETIEKLQHKQSIDNSNHQGELRRLDDEVRSKDDIIRQLRNNNTDSSSSDKYEADVHQLQEELKLCKKTQTHYQQQNDSLSKQLEGLRKTNQLLTTQIGTMTSKMAEMEHNRLQNHSAELSKLQAEQRTLESAHHGELEGMKRQMAAVATQLHEKTLAFSTLSEKLLTTDQQLKDYTDQLDKKHAELQVATAQLEALRLENRHLRQSNLAQDGTDVDLSEAERHLKDLQNAYSTSIASLEAQNRKLQSDVILLKNRLAAVEDDSKDRLQRALAESQKTMQMLQEQEQKKVEELEVRSRRTVEDAEERLNATVEQYESQIESLQLEMSTMQDDINLQNQSMRRLGLEHDVMSKFVSGVDLMLQPSTQGGASQGNSHTRDTSFDIDDELEDDYLTDTADAATAKFLRDQEERSRKLEEQLNNHIEYLKTSANSAVRRHVSASH